MTKALHATFPIGWTICPTRGRCKRLELSLQNDYFTQQLSSCLSIGCRWCGESERCWLTLKHWPELNVGPKYKSAEEQWWPGEGGGGEWAVTTDIQWISIWRWVFKEIICIERQLRVGPLGGIQLRSFLGGGPEHPLVSGRYWCLATLHSNGNTHTATTWLRERKCNL